VWSIVCFYIAKQYRRQGTLLQLIEGAVQYVKEQGGKIIESYPTVPRGRKLPPVSSFMGIPKVFEQAGFTVSARPSSAKIIMRKIL
jgi:predicted GNAT family acetyltransferase